MPTKIEWAEETWNPIVGCSKCSPGCEHCYAERMANRQASMALAKGINDTTRGRGRYIAVIGPGGKWSGATSIDETEGPEGELYKPLRIKTPRRIFVCSMADLFHEYNPDEWINAVVNVQDCASQHTYLWLTKRPERMREYSEYCFRKNGPIKNIWCGVTVCNQEEADEKIPVLLPIPAAVRFVSMEPMLGRIDLERWGTEWLDKLNWVIVGGESGPGARPMYPDWIRSIRDQCVAAGVPFMFKQWGSFDKFICIDKINRINAGWNSALKKGGRILDGKIYDEYPEVK